MEPTSRWKTWRWIFWPAVVLSLVVTLGYVALVIFTQPHPKDPAATEAFLRREFSRDEILAGAVQPVEITAALEDADRARITAASGTPGIHNFSQLFGNRSEPLEADAMTPELWTDLDTLLKTWEPYRVAVMRYAEACRQRGGAIELSPASWKDGLLLSRVRATADLHGAQYGKALEHLLPAYALFRGATTETSSHYLFLARSRVISSGIASAARGCTDVVTLRAALDEMNAAPLLDTTPPTEEMLVVEIVRNVQTMQRNDVPVMISARPTVSDLAYIYYEQALYWHGMGVGKGDVPWSVKFGELWTELERGPERFFGNGDEALINRARLADVMGWHGQAVGLVVQAGDNASSYRRTLEEWVHEARAAYDLARLELAARIEELEGRLRPTRVEDLAPEYFDAPLLDPFTGKPYLYSATREAFYSIGPDGVDDGAGTRLEVNPQKSNAGDYWLPADRDEPWRAMWEP